MSSTQPGTRLPACPRSTPGHDACDELLGAVLEEDTENDANINASKEEGDSDLLSQLQHEVTAIALPSSVKQERGKGKGGKPKEKDDRRSDASKGRFKCALMETVAPLSHKRCTKRWHGHHLFLIAELKRQASRGNKGQDIITKWKHSGLPLSIRGPRRCCT